MAEKITRKDLFARIKDTMAGDPEVVAMCDKYIEQLSRPRKPRVNKEAIAFAETVYNKLVALDEPTTNKEMTAALNEGVAEDETVSPQKVAHAFKRLVDEGKVIRSNGEKAKDPAVFTVA